MNSASVLFDKVLGSLLGGVVGDAMGTPTEKLTHAEIQQKFGWVTRFSGDGTDDSALKHMLCETIVRTNGYPTADDWAQEWLRHEKTFIGSTLFFAPVVSTFWKLRGEQIAPRDAGAGNMASSSSAMCISPMGILHAGNPRLAALETLEVASLIHHNFCRDAACSMAAAVAQAFTPGATVESVIDAATRYLAPRSAAPMVDAVRAVMELAHSCGNYEEFRARFERQALASSMHFTDSRETVPVSLALLYLADGDPRKTIEYGANFGRDADTIASMAGAIAGALHGAKGLPKEWMTELGAAAARQEELAERMARAALARANDSIRHTTALHALNEEVLP